MTKVELMGPRAIRPLDEALTAMSNVRLRQEADREAAAEARIPFERNTRHRASSPPPCEAYGGGSAGGDPGR
jgi:hypothetical protein